MTGDQLATAVRVYAERLNERPRPGPRRVRTMPNVALVFDTETTVDASQRLTFGAYRYLRFEPDGSSVCIREGLFHADDLPKRDPEGFAILQEYVRTHDADVGVAGSTARKLPLVSRREFVERVLYPASFKARALVVGFNLPFDLARIAVGWGEARGQFAGGISHQLWAWQDPQGRRREHRFRPRIAVKALDSKRALIGFTRPLGVDAEDQIPDGSVDGRPDPKYTFRGNFLDLRTLAFSLTNASHSLASACRAFGVEHGKFEGVEHGTITPEYVDFSRRDVLASAELSEKLLAELARHPIELAPMQAYSPASIGKAYLRAMGIAPVLERQPDFPPEVLGYAMTGFYGGRAECRIRRTMVPVVYLDVLSMYPTVNALMGLWELLTAERIDMRDDTDEVSRFLEAVDLAACFDPTTWRHLPVLVQVAPAHDILPVRARYDGQGSSWQIGINVLSSDEPRWYALPDVIASKLLTGRTPRVLRALRLVPVGRSPGLQRVRLRGTVEVDPSARDFFLSVIEERKRVASRPALSPDERKRTDAFLKVLANSTSYGVFAEMVRHELSAAHTEPVRIFGLSDPFDAKVAAPEDPGSYCFPPIAACITAAARLILAMLERSVSDAGGTYAMCDTDSMAIVAAEREEMVACEGGTERLTGGEAAIRALSWRQVEEIRGRFEALNPYDRASVSGSVLKLEDVNYREGTDERHQLYAWAISAKRYALFNVDDGGSVFLRKWSEHGLGHLLNPTDPDSSDADWIRQLWGYLLSAEVLMPQAADPTWLDRPAVSRVTAATPMMLRPFKTHNAGRPYADQVKPGNFLLSAHVAPFGHPTGAEPTRFHLVAPYTRDGRQWTKMNWLDVYSGERFRITTHGTPSNRVARVRSYRDVLDDYRTHREAKSSGADGRAADRRTFGLLARRHVEALALAASYIGKEANRIDDVAVGLVHSEAEVLVEYCDPSRDCFERVVRPWMKERPKRELSKLTGLSERQIASIRNGRTLPRSRVMRILRQAAANVEMTSRQLQSR